MQHANSHALGFCCAPQHERRGSASPAPCSGCRCVCAQHAPSLSMQGRQPVQMTPSRAMQRKDSSSAPAGHDGDVLHDMKTHVRTYTCTPSCADQPTTAAPPGSTPSSRTPAAQAASVLCRLCSPPALPSCRRHDQIATSHHDQTFASSQHSMPRHAKICVYQKPKVRHLLCPCRRHPPGTCPQPREWRPLHLPTEHGPSLARTRPPAHVGLTCLGHGSAHRSLQRDATTTQPGAR